MNYLLMILVLAMVGAKKRYYPCCDAGFKNYRVSMCRVLEGKKNGSRSSRF